MLVVSAYQQYRLSSEMALLSDSTSSIATHLTLDELAYVDATGTSHPYVVDAAKLSSLGDFRRKVGGDNFEFQVSVFYMRENECVLGPYGSTLPEEKMNCTLIFAATIFENDRYLPVKIKVIAWRA
jgi:hypothetical protein